MYKTKRKINKNRRKDKKLNTWAAPIRVVVILIFIALPCLVYAVLQNDCSSLERQIKQEEIRKIELEKNLKTETQKWINATSMNNVKHKLYKHGITMNYPAVGQRSTMTAKRSLNKVNIMNEQTYAANR